MGVPLAGLLILFLFPVTVHGSDDEIFSDDFESGDVTAWSSSLGGGCKLVKSDVPDCDFEHGLGSWQAIPSASITFVPGDDSDGEAFSGSVEIAADTDGAELSLCFAKSTPGAALYTRQLDARRVSGTLAQGFCFASFGVYAGENCDGEQIDFSIAAFSPGPTWSLRTIGQSPVPTRAKSFFLQIGCTGSGGDASVRFDDLVVTAETLGSP